MRTQQGKKDRARRENGGSLHTPGMKRPSSIYGREEHGKGKRKKLRWGINSARAGTRFGATKILRITGKKRRKERFLLKHLLKKGPRFNLPSGGRKVRPGTGGFLLRITSKLREGGGFHGPNGTLPLEREKKKSIYREKNDSKERERARKGDNGALLPLPQRRKVVSANEKKGE